MILETKLVGIEQGKTRTEYRKMGRIIACGEVLE